MVLYSIFKASVNASGNVNAMSPALVVTKAEMDEGIAMMDQALEKADVYVVRMNQEILFSVYYLGHPEAAKGTAEALTNCTKH